MACAIMGITNQNFSSFLLWVDSLYADIFFMILPEFDI
jgi:hypothetical protein